MKPGGIVEDKQINGQHVVIRYIAEDDLPEIVKHQNILSSEQTFIDAQGEQVTTQEYAKTVNELVKNMERGRGISLLLIVDDQIAGLCGLTKQTKGATQHTASLGITLQKTHRGKGYGKIFLEMLLNEAAKNMEGLEVIRLECFADNESAINLYKKLGFVEYGRLPKGFKRKGAYHEDLLMYKTVTKV